MFINTKVAGKKIPPPLYRNTNHDNNHILPMNPRNNTHRLNVTIRKEDLDQKKMKMNGV